METVASNKGMQPATQGYLISVIEEAADMRLQLSSAWFRNLCCRDVNIAALAAALDSCNCSQSACVHMLTCPTELL